MMRSNLHNADLSRAKWKLPAEEWKTVAEQRARVINYLNHNTSIEEKISKKLDSFYDWMNKKKDEFGL